MNSDINATTSNLERQSSHGYASSESDAKRPGGSSGKKRASRAGTRSVTTLSAAQLERKRANDREAQRAIRQRTKDHIESLEKTVSELRSVQESNEKVVAATRQRNRELEDEIAYLRSKLEGGGYGSDVLQSNSMYGMLASLGGIDRLHSKSTTRPCDALSAFDVAASVGLGLKHPTAKFHINAAEPFGDYCIDEFAAWIVPAAGAFPDNTQLRPQHGGTWHDGRNNAVDDVEIPRWDEYECNPYSTSYASTRSRGVASTT